jgi:16S rRNA processing protein RimM
MIPVGRITRTHGVRGAVKIHPYGESLAVQTAGDKVYLQACAGVCGRELTIDCLSPQGNLFIARFGEITTMDEAQAVRGEEVFLPEESLPPASEGEYYHYQLIGLVVESRDGTQIGVLRGIIETPGSDIYAVDCGGKEILVPAVDEIICEIDLERGRVVIDPPEGLIESADL